MEQKPIPVEQVNPDPMDDGLNATFGSNQVESMRIDTSIAKHSEACTANSSSTEVYSHNLLHARAIHMVRIYIMNLEIHNEHQK